MCDFRWKSYTIIKQKTIGQTKDTKLYFIQNYKTYHGKRTGSNWTGQTYNIKYINKFINKTV